MVEEIKITQENNGDMVGRFADAIHQTHEVRTVKAQSHRKLYIDSRICLDRQRARVLGYILARFAITGSMEEIQLTPEQVANFKQSMTEFNEQEQNRFKPVRAKLLEIDGWAKFIVERAGNEANAAVAQNIRDALKEVFTGLDEAIG